jgi:hypothetical protein
MINILNGFIKAASAIGENARVVVRSFSQTNHVTLCRRAGSAPETPDLTYKIEPSRPGQSAPADQNSRNSTGLSAKNG